MKRKQEKPAYDRIAAGERLRSRRVELGWSRELVAERLGVVNKYYADIERGTCGMSVETLINLSRLYVHSKEYTKAKAQSAKTSS